MKPLIPCPYCGGTNFAHQGERVGCLTCGAIAPKLDPRSKLSIVENANRRWIQPYTRGAQVKLVADAETFAAAVEKVGGKIDLTEVLPCRACGNKKFQADLAGKDSMIMCDRCGHTASGTSAQDTIKSWTFGDDDAETAEFPTLGGVKG